MHALICAGNGGSSHNRRLVQTSADGHRRAITGKTHFLVSFIVAVFWPLFHHAENVGLGIGQMVMVERRSQKPRACEFDSRPRQKCCSIRFGDRSAILSGRLPLHHVYQKACVAQDDFPLSVFVVSVYYVAITLYLTIEHSANWLRSPKMLKI